MTQPHDAAAPAPGSRRSKPHPVCLFLLCILSMLMIAVASPALAIDPDKVIDGLKDKGFDWLKDKAKEAAEDWVFDTGQSETMHGILTKCQEAVGGLRELATENDKCLAVVKFEAINILSGINTDWLGKGIAKVGFDTLTKLGSLAAGGAAAAGEGGLLGWLSGQYARAAKDTAIDKLKKFLFDEKLPEYELFEREGTDGACSYTLRAVWDIVHGTYKVLIQGDCHCKDVGDRSKNVETMKLGTWWIAFEGKVRMAVDAGQKTVTWTPGEATYTWDAQCNCNKKTLKQPYTGRVATGTSTTSGTGVTETSPGPGKPVPPPRGQKVCSPCQPIQDKIDAAWATLDQIKLDIAGATNRQREAQTRLEGDQERLREFKADPKAFDTTEAALNGKIKADQDDIAKAAEELKALDTKQKDIEKQLEGLGTELKNCIRDQCGGHGSLPQEYRTLLPGLPEDEETPPRTEYVANPGDDVAKDDVVLIDTGTQKEIPGGKVVIIPADPAKPIPPPIHVTANGRARLPQTEPHDRVIFLLDDHPKVELDGGDLPADRGERLIVPEEPRRLIVHDTPCNEVTLSLIVQGLADQYGERLPPDVASAWDGADYRFATADFARADCVVTVPLYVPLHPGEPVTDGGSTDGGGKIPKDGPTLTREGKIIEGDQPRKVQGPPPTEPFARSQGTWGQAYPDQWYLKAVHWLKPDGTSVLPASGAPVTVAVIDTGVDFGHPELAAAKWVNPAPGPRGDLAGWNFVDNSPDIRDLSGHGTIVAGIIAAASAERFGIAGINPWARIMALKAMEIDGKGGSITLAQAIVYAADHGARVINLSVGGRTLTRTEQDAVDYAARRDALVVVASGNEGIETANFSPAGLKNVLAVAAIGPDLKRQAFSNWGGTIAIAAPGVDILSLRARQTDLLAMTRSEYEPGSAVVAGQFYRVTGSSFAAPMVSGAASLLFSVTPGLTAAQARRMLLQSARDLEGIGTNQFSGYGLLDIEGALAASPDRYAEAAIAGVAAVKARGSVVLRVTGTADADSLKDAHLEIGAGDNPTRWKAAARPLPKPVVNGVLADLPADLFRGGKQWTLRVIVQDRAGLRREARFKLTLG